MPTHNVTVPSIDFSQGVVTFRYDVLDEHVSTTAAVVDSGDGIHGKFTFGAGYNYIAIGTATGVTTHGAVTPAGSTSITLGGGCGTIIDGDVITFGDDPTEYSVQIGASSTCPTSLAGSTITLYSAVASNIPAGSTVTLHERFTVEIYRNGVWQPCTYLGGNVHWEFTEPPTPYEAFEFVATSSGRWTILVSAEPTWDTRSYLYEGTFNPAAPTTNRLASSTELAAGRTEIVHELVAGTTYIVVTTGVLPTDQGAYRLTASPEVVIEHSGATDGTWNRPTQNGSLPPQLPLSDIGTAVPFDTFEFTAPLSGTWSFLVTSDPAWDTQLFLYANAFDDTDPITNCLIGNDEYPPDDTPIPGQAGFSYDLVAGATYIAVVTGYENTDDGAYTLRIGMPMGCEPLVELPAQGGSVSIPVQDSSWITAGDVLTNESFGPFTVTAVGEGVVTVTNDGTETGVVPEGTLLFRSATAEREPIRLLREVVSYSGARHLLVATQSRLYASTGSGRNFKIIADGLAESVTSTVRPQVSQLGDYVCFTNGIDPVLFWRIGSDPITEGDAGYRLWSAFESYDLTGLGIQRAGVVSAWGGFLFLADVTVSTDRQSSRVYWCDYNRPLEWAPGGESTAGYVDLGGGETVLAILPLGSGLRCYTDRAIYRVDFVGGDAVFNFRELYRGDDVLSFKHGIVDTGSVHLWLTQDSIAVATEYDFVPQRIEWLHKASGLIYNGLDERLLKSCPVDFTAPSPLVRSDCDLLTMGFDSRRGDVWISWPSVAGTAHNTTSLVLNLHYGKASLVDYGFSAFCMARDDTWDTVRDFLVANGICDQASLLSDTELLHYKEGYPQNVPPDVELLDQENTPLWNATNDPTLPAAENALIPMFCDQNLVDLCKTCFDERDLLMADAAQWTILRFDPATYSRQSYSAEEDTPATFPEVSAGAYATEGYPTLVQTEASALGARQEKLIKALNVEFDAGDVDVTQHPETPIGNLHVQIGVSNTPHCLDWSGASSKPLTCLRGNAYDSLTEGQLRPARPAAFPFHKVGAYVGWRLYVSADDSTSPTGCAVALNSAEAAVKAKAATWRTA